MSSHSCRKMCIVLARNLVLMRTELKLLAEQKTETGVCNWRSGKPPILVVVKSRTDLSLLYTLKLKLLIKLKLFKL